MQLVTKTVQNAEADPFTAIAHPVRRQILDMLRSGQQPVKQLASAFEVSRPAISQHLKVLLDAGLVSEKRTGREHYYRLQANRLQEVQDWVGQYEQFWNQKLDALGRYLEQTQPPTGEKEDQP
ncbi:MAG TPA: metalloregulator ArsR/SmtB family transcription factor [Chloroflexia bacterium]|nr:metalloregulator ArsR/SmtB family transcription factor [Chloroflexia bacterium]